MLRFSVLASAMTALFLNLSSPALAQITTPKCKATYSDGAVDWGYNNWHCTMVKANCDYSRNQPADPGGPARSICTGFVNL